MGRSHSRRARPLSALQVAILKVLWARREATVTEVQAALEPERTLAATTVATTLTRMEAKRLVAHRVDGRQFVYRANVAEGDVRKSVVAELADRFFAGDVAALVSHLLEERDVDAADLERIESLIARRRKDLRRGR